MEIRNISGTLFYYYFVCKRKLWLFFNELNMEHSSDRVALGKLLDEASYTRDEKHITIDNTISIDFIRGREVLHEIKKSKSVEEASLWQVKYYLYYLRKRGVMLEKAKLDFPLIRETVSVEWEEKYEYEVERILDDIENILSKEIPPDTINSKICKSCAYFEGCYI